MLEKTLERPLDYKEIKPEYSLEGLKLGLQYFSDLMGRANSLERTFDAGKDRSSGERRQQRMRWLDTIPDSDTDRGR